MSHQSARQRNVVASHMKADEISTKKLCVDTIASESFKNTINFMDNTNITKINMYSKTTSKNHT